MTVSADATPSVMTRWMRRVRIASSTPHGSTVNAYQECTTGASRTTAANTPAFVTIADGSLPVGRRSAAQMTRMTARPMPAPRMSDIARSPASSLMKPKK